MTAVMSIYLLKLAFKKLGLKGLILAVLLPVSLLTLVIYAII